VGDVVGGTEILGKRVLREVERQMSGHEHVRFCLRGRRRHCLVALDERLLIVRPRFNAVTATVFDYDDVTAIELRTSAFTGGIDVWSPGERRPSRITVSKRRAGDYDHALAQLRERIGHAQRRLALAADTPPLIASLERIAQLRRSGALSEDEYGRLKEVLMTNADRGMSASEAPSTLSAPEEREAWST